MGNACNVSFRIQHLFRKGMACCSDPQQRQIIWMLPQCNLG